MIEGFLKRESMSPTFPQTHAVSCPPGELEGSTVDLSASLDPQWGGTNAFAHQPASEGRGVSHREQTGKGERELLILSVRERTVCDCSCHFKTFPGAGF